jgi:sugar O-acyltransferase (sialic acid O-acetyltransferase NeuD family)
MPSPQRREDAKCREGIIARSANEFFAVLRAMASLRLGHLGLSSGVEKLSEKIIIHGSGGHARVVLDCLLESRKNVIALFDPKHSEPLFGVPQKGPYDPEIERDARAIVAIGDNRIRQKVATTTTHTFTNAIHSSAIISSRATIGKGNMILHGTIIQAQTVIGDHVIINTGARIDHDCRIGSFVHIAPGAIIAGTVEVGEGAFIGAGAIVIQGCKVGAWATVGAGAVVIEDIPDFAVAVGTPARVIKYNKP